MLYKILQYFYCHVRDSYLDQKKNIKHKLLSQIKIMRNISLTFNLNIEVFTSAMSHNLFLS